MGSSPSNVPDIDFPAEPPSGPVYIPPPPLPVYARRREPILRYLVLFLLTIFTTTYAGTFHYASFSIGFTNSHLALHGWNLFARGLWYSLSILAILGAHEFGHYYACRYYRVDASIPYFLPAP